MMLGMVDIVGDEASPQRANKLLSEFQKHLVFLW